jgi:hypothetical protein
MSMAAADWAKRWLRPDSRFLSDRTNRMLLAVYGLLIRQLLGLGMAALARALGPVLGAGCAMAGVVAALAPHLAGLSGSGLALGLGGVAGAGAASYGVGLWLSGFGPARKAGVWVVARLRR